MELEFYMIRKIFVIGIWIYVGIQMVPAAQSQNRNPVLWYFIGLFGFYIPFAIVGFLPPVVMLILMKNGIDIASGVFQGVGTIAFGLGVSVGFAGLHFAKTNAEAPSPNDSSGDDKGDI